MVNTPSSPAATVLDLVSPRRDWAVAGAALVLALCALGYIFRAEIAMAVYVWNDSDAYNHCFLVIPVAAYLAWDRRQAIAATMPRPAPWIALLGIPVAAAWFVADRLGVFEGRQLTAMTLFQVMVPAIIGFTAWRALSAPLLYLFFLVPFGEFLVPPLQTLVVHFTTTGLDLLGIPTFSNGIIIEIPEGTFIVHQACSGLRFLIASAAFGVLYACVMYTSPLRRLVFSVLALAVAIVGNCFRVLGTILAAHFIGNARAVEADHVLWGWGFYVIIGATLIVIGFAFRQERHPPLAVASSVSGRTVGASVVALASVILLAAAPRVAADYLNRMDAGATVANRVEMPVLRDCTQVRSSNAATAAAAQGSFGATASRSASYRCGDETFLLTLYRYGPRIGVRPLFVSMQAAEMPAGGDILLQTDGFRAGPGPDAPIWQITDAHAEGDRYIATATALWLNGRPSGVGIAARLDQALNTFRPAPSSPALAVATYVAKGDLNTAQRAIRSFLPRTAGLSEFVQKWVAAPTTHQ
jgi:exosortase A